MEFDQIQLTITPKFNADFEYVIRFNVNCVSFRMKRDLKKN